MSDTATTTVTEHDREQVEQANASGLKPVVFIHGLWLLPSSWQRWGVLFEEAGYAVVLPSWPDDPETVAEGNEDPSVFAGKTVGGVAEHLSTVIAGLDQKPAIIGHSIGGLLTQILAGRGLAAASVAIDPGPFRGVLPLPFALLKATSPVWRNPANHHRAVPLTYDQFRYGFANAVPEEEARELYATFAVPASGTPIFQAASANLNPATQAKVDTSNPERGPLLIISGGQDHTVPTEVSKAAYDQQKGNLNTTEFIDFADRGHGLVIDHGWREVAEVALQFVRRFD
jgi:non-heme chloroperoxidase